MPGAGGSGTSCTTKFFGILFFFFCLDSTGGGGGGACTATGVGIGGLGGGGGGLPPQAPSSAVALVVQPPSVASLPAVSSSLAAASSDAVRAWELLRSPTGGAGGGCEIGCDACPSSLPGGAGGGISYQVADGLRAYPFLSRSFCPSSSLSHCNPTPIRVSLSDSGWSDGTTAPTGRAHGSGSGAVRLQSIMRFSKSISSSFTEGSAASTGGSGFTCDIIAG